MSRTAFRDRLCAAATDGALLEAGAKALLSELRG
jgi:hypothetical protein